MRTLMKNICFKFFLLVHMYTASILGNQSVLSYFTAKSVIEEIRFPYYEHAATRRGYARYFRGGKQEED